MLADQLHHFHVAAVAFGPRHPFEAAAQLDFETSMAEFQAHVDLFAKPIGPAVGVLGQQVGEIDRAIVGRHFVGPFDAEQLVNRLVEELARQIPKRHRAGAQRPGEPPLGGLVETKRTLAQQSGRPFLADRAIADAFDARVGEDPQHPVAAAVAVNVEPGVLAGQLVTAAGEVEADHARDFDVFGRLGAFEHLGEQR
ncbi:MAG TPA: hypothetical protein VFX03_15930, partial [Thermomicrobiales bacterium]|nr:hypothetical protein [Thermomicrobiales bacterium]